MNTIPLVAALAAAWHLSMMWIERSHRTRRVHAGSGDLTIPIGDVPYGQLLEKVGRFIELPAAAISKASRLGEEISREACGIKKTVKLNSGTRGELSRLVAKLESLSSRLSRSVSNSKRGAFRRDWTRFARSETTRLKDEVLALQEILNTVREDVPKKKR